MRDPAGGRGRIGHGIKDRFRPGLEQDQADGSARILQQLIQFPNPPAHPGPVARRGGQPVQHDPHGPGGGTGFAIGIPPVPGDYQLHRFGHCQKPRGRMPAVSGLGDQEVSHALHWSTSAYLFSFFTPNRSSWSAVNGRGPLPARTRSVCTTASSLLVAAPVWAGCTLSNARRAPCPPRTARGVLPGISGSGIGGEFGQTRAAVLSYASKWAELAVFGQAAFPARAG